MKRHLIVMAGAVLFALPVHAEYRDGVIAAQKQDFAKAYSEFKPLADQGHTDAMYGLALLYHYGRGVPRDLDKAIDLYLKAAANGNPSAMNNLGAMYQAGEGVKQDYA